MNNGIPVRNIQQKKNVSMFITNIACNASKYFSCPLVVSYRPIPKQLVEKATEVENNIYYFYFFFGEFFLTNQLTN